MDVKKEVTITLSVKELEIILKEHLEKLKGIKVTAIYLPVTAHNVKDDWRSEFPPSYSLDCVICKGTE